MNETENTNIPVKKMIKKAFKMLEKSYTPYSNFKVGAALLDADGKIWGGCNIENASYGACNCAERTAFFRAVAKGVTEFTAIVIVGGKDGEVTDFCAPCGICRQVMMEFCQKDFLIILAKSENEYKVYTLGQLLPLGFGPNSLLCDDSEEFDDEFDDSEDFDNE